MDFFENWYEEKRSAYLYRVLAIRETNETRKKLFNELAELATRQAEIWEREIKKSNQPIPEFHPDFRTHIVKALIQWFGTKPLRFILSAMKIRGMSMFAEPTNHHENRHRGLTAAGNLRAAVFGVNDGIVSNMSLILGVAGATTNLHFILLSGVAGLLAGACSMGAGEYVSMRSQREFFEYQIEIERNELEEYPEEEAAELAAIYRARGIPKEDAEKLAQVLISDPEKALATLAREELGLNPNELGSPWGAAISSFISFAIGAFIPLIPFLFGDYRWNFLISTVLTGITLFCIGTVLSLFTNRSAIRSGLRMLLIGAGAGILTYVIGHLFGAVV